MSKGIIDSFSIFSNLDVDPFNLFESIAAVFVEIFHLQSNGYNPPSIRKIVNAFNLLVRECEFHVW